MKVIKLMTFLVAVSLISIITVACNRDKGLPETKQENDALIDKPIEDDKPLQDDSESKDETLATIDTDETKETNGTDDNNEIQPDEDILGANDAKKVIEATTKQVITAISQKDAAAISEYVHPLKGVRFTPYTFVSLEGDIVLTQEEMKGFFDNTKEYLWGYYDGIGDEMKLTPSSYYDKFIYSEDFMSAPQVGYNEVLSFGNALENQFEVYESPIVVEYYFPGFNEEYEGMDWKSLRLVFEQYENGWKLVGIIHNQWTI